MLPSLLLLLLLFLLDITISSHSMVQNLLLDVVDVVDATCAPQPLVATLCLYRSSKGPTDVLRPIPSRDRQGSWDHRVRRDLPDQEGGRRG